MFLFSLNFFFVFFMVKSNKLLIFFSMEWTWRGQVEKKHTLDLGGLFPLRQRNVAFHLGFNLCYMSTDERKAAFLSSAWPLAVPKSAKVSVQ